MSKRITDRTRKRLWTKGGNRCAFTGCDQPLLHPNEAESDETVVGVECHIVAQKDHPSVARAPCLLTDEEKARWARLIERRHDFANLVLMCGVHATVIDDRGQEYSVAEVVQMKTVHEAEVAQRQSVPLPGIEAAERGAPSRQPLLLEDVPAWQRKAFRALALGDPDGLAWLQAQIGSPAEGKKVVDLVARWPSELDEGQDALGTLLVREAEALGLWTTASKAWQRLAGRSTGPARADRLARAAIDAGVGGDSEERNRLLDEAEESDPGNVRVRLARFDEAGDADGDLQLAFLAGLNTEDPDLASLIAAQRALAHLRLRDLESAEEALEEAQSLDGDSIGVRIGRVNLEVERARIALGDDRTFVMAHLLDARDEALEQREVLMGMARWEESVRLLMLAADVPSLLHDREAAKALLEQARPEEVNAREGAAVLGDAALRAGAPELALRFAESAEIERDDGIRRIAATARAEMPAAGRADALAELEDLALGGGPEAEASAIARLILCMPPVQAPWNESVAEVLQDSELSRPVQSLHVLSLALHDPDRATKLAAELPKDAWAAEVRLRVAGTRGDPAGLKQAAAEFLEFAPDASGKLLASQALGQAKEFERAGEIAAGVANDPNCPPRLRCDAYHVLMKTLADREKWPAAEQTWESWKDLAFEELGGDGRVSAWQVRVLHHKQDGRRAA